MPPNASRVLPCPALDCRLVNGTRDLLRQQSGLAHHPNYHEFCRLLGRLKANYQLSELVRTAAVAALLCPDPQPGLSLPLWVLKFPCNCTCPRCALAPRPQVGLESYKEWIQLVADFTVSSLNSWQWASGSVYYLLGLW